MRSDKDARAAARKAYKEARAAAKRGTRRRGQLRGMLTRPRWLLQRKRTKMLYWQLASSNQRKRRKSSRTFFSQGGFFPFDVSFP